MLFFSLIIFLQLLFSPRMWFSFPLISSITNTLIQDEGYPLGNLYDQGVSWPSTCNSCPLHSWHSSLMLYTCHIKCVRFLLTKGNRIFSISYSFEDSFLTTNSMREKLLSLRAGRFSVGGGDMLVLAYNIRYTIYVLWWTWSSLYRRRPDLAFFPREMTAGPRSDHHTPRRGDAKTKQSHMAASRRS